MSDTPRVRFAPSPTGDLHVGGARTALFNWLFARHENGQFLIRIEDTDRKRSETALAEEMLEELRWLGMEPEEPILWQSNRQDDHLETARQLISQGDAYYCFCDSQDHQEGGPEERAVGGCPGGCRDLERGQDGAVDPRTTTGVAIRMKVPRDQPLEITDRVYGQRTFPANSVEDFVIVRSDGTPTYNLACVCDDHAVEVTHVLRGNDHLSNTPKQALLYDRLGWAAPEFAHLPLILNPEGGKMGKRDQGASLREWRDQGVLAEGMINYLSRLGWSDRTDQELYSPEELIEKFSLEGLSKQEAAFEGDKLQWMSSEHIDRLEPEVLAERLRPWLVREGLSAAHMPAQDKIAEAVELTRERCPTLEVLAEQVAPLFTPEVEYTEKARKRFWSNRREALQALEWLEPALSQVSSWEAETVEEVIRGVADQHDVGAGKVILPLRTALTGLDVGPSIFHMLEVMGQEQSLRRIQQARQELARQLDHNPRSR